MNEKFTKENFPTFGEFDYYDLLRQISTPELETLRNANYGGGWSYPHEKITRLAIEEFRNFYGQKKSEILLTTNRTECPIIEITDKGFVLVWFADADSGGYDVALYVEIFPIVEEYFVRFGA